MVTNNVYHITGEVVDLGDSLTISKDRIYRDEIAIELRKMITPFDVMRAT